MNDQLTPNGVVSLLLELARELARLSDGLRDLEIEVVNRRADYNKAYGQAYLRSEGQVREREIIATDATCVERIAMELAEVEVRARKRDLDTVSRRIDVGRSAAAALRAEITLGGVH